MANSSNKEEMKKNMTHTLEIGVEKVQTGKYKEAIDVLDYVIENDPQNYRAWDILGFAHWSLGDVKMAERCNRKSLEIEPLGAYAHKGLGVCLAEQGKLDEAVSELHHAMALKPNWVDPVHDLAMVLYKAKRFEQAPFYIQRTIEMEPKFKSRLIPMLENAKSEIEKEKNKL